MCVVEKDQVAVSGWRLVLGGFLRKKSPPTPSAETVVFRMNLLAAPVIPKPSLESLLSICCVDMENEQFIFFSLRKHFILFLQS